MNSLSEDARLRPTWHPVASATGCPSYSGVFPRDERAAGEARVMVATVLAVWHLPRLVADAELVASELVTNAVRHARGPDGGMTVTRTGHTKVRVAVTDGSPLLPRLRVADLLAETGRGLRLVDGLSQDWGVTPCVRGKSVWAEVGEAGTG
ncbi:serine/threonine protein phosphatase [Streptomyces sp. Tu 6176]|uniref:ATP-binding protein n=1 Tax=Streptomyces sp. Tu 6176 TaxID=1470557 RepID=UPI00044A3706|nr:ATP-binding protein [Streptomyces sp. Tu 6176]EYT78276.1 serine/threonine protein phosphatase [Streptomyces sp. Tu 6176]